MLDYTQRKKKTLPVKLFDGMLLTLNIPTKKLFTRLSEIETALSAEGDETDMYDNILEIAAEILSTNHEGKTYTASDVDAIMDMEDMALLVFEYGKFAGSVTADPNSASPAIRDRKAAGAGTQSSPSESGS